MSNILQTINPSLSDSEVDAKKVFEEIDSPEAPEEKPAEAAEPDTKPEVKVEEPKKEEPKKEEEKPEKPEKKAETTEEEGEAEPVKETVTPKKAEEPKLIFGKYKTQEEAEKGYRSLETQFHNVNRSLREFVDGKIPADFASSLQKRQEALSRPLADISIPKASDYTEEDGTLRLDDYMNDFAQKFVVSMQQSMVSGKIAAQLYGVLANVVESKVTSSYEDTMQETRARDMESRLFADFPVLRQTDTEKETDQSFILRSQVAQLIYGEKARREAIQRNGGGVQPEISYEDIKNLAISVVGKTNVPDEKPEVVETIKPSPATLRGKAKVTNADDDDIDAMLEASQRRTSIF